MDKIASARDQFRSAYRAYRIKRQIKWAPEHVDPDDIDPKKFAPGGEYYNSPELLDRYNAASPWHPSFNGCQFDWDATVAAMTAISTRRPGMEEQHQERVKALLRDREWENMWGGAVT